MGEISEMMLEGILDEQTGEYLGEAVGYPRTRNKPNNPIVGIRKWLKKNKPDVVERDVLVHYATTILQIENAKNTANKTIAFEIQKDFLKFTKFIHNLKPE